MTKEILFISGLFLCSFDTTKGRNSLQEQHLKGRVISVTEYNFRNEDDTAGAYLAVKHIYNVMGNETERRCFSGDIPRDSVFYTYNVKGKLVEENSISWRTLYTYDSNDVLAETNRYGREDSGLMERVTFEYDQSGNEKELNSFRGDGKANHKMIITTKANGDREEVVNNADGESRQICC